MGTKREETVYIKNDDGTFSPLESLKGTDGENVYETCRKYGYTGTEDELNDAINKLPEIIDRLFGPEYHFADNQKVYMHDDDEFYNGKSVTEKMKEINDRITYYENH